MAEVDGEAVSLQAFEQFLRRNAVDGSGVLDSNVLSSLLDQFLDERLLTRLTVDRLGLAAEVGSVAAAQALLATAVENIDDDAVASYYREHASQFDRPARSVAAPERQSTRFTGGRRDHNAIACYRFDPPGARAQRNVVASARFEDHFFVELTDTRTVFAEVDTVGAPVRNGAGIHAGHHRCAATRRQGIVCAVPGQ